MLSAVKARNSRMRKLALLALLHFGYIGVQHAAGEWPSNGSQLAVVYATARSEPLTVKIQSAEEQRACAIAVPAYKPLEPQNWGRSEKGIRVSLATDQKTYNYGQRIALTLQWDRSRVCEPLAFHECGEDDPTIELQDAGHVVLQRFQLLDGETCWSHGDLLSPWYGGGLSRVNYLTPSQNGSHGYHVIASRQVLFTKPGTYYLVAVWSPLLAESCGVSQLEHCYGSKYATARSVPVQIKILPSDRE